MPNTSNDDVIIVGSLSDKELRDSIDKLVDYVGDKTTIMAGKFDVAMEKMKSAMKDFAITQKVSVDLMQDAWKQMSASFDAMLKAQQAAYNGNGSSGSTGGGSGKPTYDDDTVGKLQEIIALEEKRRKDMKLFSDELRDQNKLIEEQKAILSRATTSDQKKLLQVAKKELQMAFTMPARELSDAEKKLQQLQLLSARFQGKGILDPVQWNRLQTQIQSTQEKIDKLRQKKPTSIQDVLGMDESSVDAIAKKMAALKKVTVDPQNTAQVKQLGDEYQRLKRLQAELMGQNIQMTHSNNYLAQSFGYIRNRLVYAMTLGTITSFTKQVYEIRGQYELLERSLGVLVNSFERGSQIFQELNQMAIESPFTLMELAGAAKQLTAYNFAANEVVDTTRRLADISAALGVPMERLTYNLGQIRAQTVLTARDARDFANAGLPIVASLAEHFTELEGKIVTTGDVYDRMSKKMVSYSDVMAVLNKMTDEGGKFFEFQAKQAETLRVQMANLNLAWNNMLNDIGKSNQGLLTLPVSGLKALFQNWQSIDRILKSMVITFGLWKVLQVVAIRQQWAWASATGATAKQMGVLGNAAKSLWGGLKALFLNPWTWVFVGIQAIVDLTHQFTNARSAMHELNQEIRNNASESSESMLGYLNNKGNQSTRQLAQQNNLTTEHGEKAWESISEQINKSALSANSLIAELQAIPDINERVRVGFDYAERIQKAQAALQDLKEDTIEVSSTYSILGVNIKEGLVDDLKDLVDELDGISGYASMFDDNGQIRDVSGGFVEYRKEIEKTAESIKHFITDYNITDPLQINEILERVRAQIKAKNPEIKGEMAKVFDISLDARMAALTNGAVDRNASLWNMFMERLRHNSSSAFQDINDEWIKKNTALSKEQQEAVDANLQYFKDSMPYAYDAVAKMVSDASQLRIKIGITFGGTNATDFQKQVNERIGNAIKTLDFGGSAFLPTNNDNLSSWVKTQQQAIKSLKEENKKYALDDSQWSKDKIAANDREIQQRKNLLDLFHQQYAEEKKGSKGGNRKPEDVVAEALKQELQLIREMQSNYDKLRKSGVSNMDAIDIASKGYEATIVRINQVLSKFGIDKFNAANFAGKDVRSLLQSLEEQRKALLASGKVKTSSLQALDVEIQKLTVDAKTYDMKKVTDGLNSELGKIKDEYELAIELDANPELGGIFANMFDIDQNSLPSTIEEYAERVTKQLNGFLKNEKIELPHLYLTDDDLKAFKDMMNDGKITQVAYDLIEKNVKNIHDLREKDAKDTLKRTKELEYKLADTNGKIAIEQEKLANFERLLAKETHDEKKHLLELEIAEQQEVIEKLRMEIMQTLPLYKALFGGTAEHSAVMTRKLAKQYRDALDKATRNANDTYTYTDPISGDKTILTSKERGKQMEKADAELRKSQSSLKKIKEAFTKGSDDVVDFWQGIAFISDEMQKLGDVVSNVGSLAEMLGANKETVEIINDIGTSISGVATMASGITQIASGDYLGGAASVISGLTQTIGTWLDNSDNKIVAQIEESERAVKRLETSYKNLEYAINQAYGMATIGANKAAIANKELQLVELKRQLSLEQSRDGKHRDENAIESLRSQIFELEHSISDMMDNITNDLLGISSVGDAAKSFMDNYVEALRSGEGANKVFEQSLDDMIANMVKKMLTTKIIQPWFENVWDSIQNEINRRGESSAKAYEEAQRNLDRAKQVDLENADSIVEALRNLGKSDEEIYNIMWKDGGKNQMQRLVAAYQKSLAEAERNAEEKSKQLANDTQVTVDDIRRYADLLRSGQPIMDENMQAIKDLLQSLGLINDDLDSKNLSALQQGIQSITEDTAGAIEAYMNIVAQKVFEQNLYLQEIRDHLNNFDLDVQLGTLSQMLLQLQQSYQVQQNIESILTGVLNPSGRAIVVELNS